MSNPTRILIVDSDRVAARALGQLLNKHNYDTVTAACTDEAIHVLEQERAAVSEEHTSVVIADHESTHQVGSAGLIRRLHDDWPGVVPIMVSGFRKVESAVQAMRLGAADYLLKPIVQTELLDAVERAQQRAYLMAGSGPEDVQDNSEAAEELDPQEPGLDPVPATDAQANDWVPMSLSEAMKEPERRILIAALKANDWNRQQTAAQLDINRTTLYKKIRQYRLDEPA